MLPSQIKYEYAFDARGTPRHISDLDSAPPYKCGDCDGEMIAKQGDIRQWHFAHKTDLECTPKSDPDNALHRYAQDIVIEAFNRNKKAGTEYLLGVKCPGFQIDICSGQVAKNIALQNSEMGKELSIIPDTRSDLVLSKSDGSQVILEVVNTHPLDTETKERYIESEIPVCIRNLTWDTLDELSEKFIADECLNIEPLHLCDQCLERKEAFEAERERKLAREEEQICDSCQRPLNQTFSGTVWGDWSDDPNYRYCIECAASVHDAQWIPPGDMIGGIELPGINASISEKFLAFNTAEFRAMVWNERKNRAQTQQGGRTEGNTAKQLDLVEMAFNNGEWDLGYELLQPIAAPSWGARDHNNPLYAWKPENCIRVSNAWNRLREQRLNELPDPIASIIKERGFRQQDHTNKRYAGECEQKTATSDSNRLIHRGFPDGRFTACGIDRDTVDKPIIVNMSETPSCPDCKAVKKLY